MDFLELERFLMENYRLPTVIWRLLDEKVNIGDSIEKSLRENDLDFGALLYTQIIFLHPKFLAPKEHHLFFTDRRLLKKEHGVLKKRFDVLP